ncbi:hypothetical protein CE195_04760 [Sodalis-like symbiont of Philaenus spumarius]|nr:hypothetical protein CE195_11895 [Sodalis-like symbiont of Philaenus spumarius]OZI15004.1 hypothetical protein CE195_04760 [Sodalis-like symbiont of Philaenus spumarius]
MNVETKEIMLEPADNNQLLILYGPFDDNIKQLEHRLGIEINRCDNTFKLVGKPLCINPAASILTSLYFDTAGTGKTYLAVAAAVDVLERQEIRHILVTRPAVEVGEKLGFLPGDLSQKVDPYQRSLYDALFEMLGFEWVEKLIECNVIEVATLAYIAKRLNFYYIIEMSYSSDFRHKVISTLEDEG